MIVEFTGFTGTVQTTTPLAMVPTPGSTHIHPMIFTIGRTKGMPILTQGHFHADLRRQMPHVARQIDRK